MGAVTGGDAIAGPDPAYQEDLTIGGGRRPASNPGPEDGALNWRLNAIGSTGVRSGDIGPRDIQLAAIYAGDIRAAEVHPEHVIDALDISILSIGWAEGLGAAQADD